MPVMDEFKNERAQMKNQPFKKKLEYFWDYYKWWVVGGVAVLITAIILINQLLEKKNDALYIAAINTVTSESISSLGGNLTLDTSKLTSAASTIDEGIGIPFMEENGINTAKNRIFTDTQYLLSGVTEASAQGGNLTPVQSLAIYIASGDVDLMTASENDMKKYAYQDFFKPVSDYLTEEELAKYADKLYYFDKAIYERYNAAMLEGKIDYEEEYPEGNDPSVMEDPVAIGIYLDDSVLYNSYFLSIDGTTEHSVIGMIVNTEEPELAKKYMIYLLETQG